MYMTRYYDNKTLSVTLPHCGQDASLYSLPNRRSRRHRDLSRALAARESNSTRSIEDISILSSSQMVGREKDIAYENGVPRI
ncbi:hypothetical protein CEXT_423491 [Caerostris extrusa]|uniref:Uncharacterized protein n=1 Tax=Caerostris extrusa TaxID=172846 RepID=A0AAV4V4W2_CAEEX|nr:hypothetical protein CEXT_423491 [Caerostris extrusa]